MPVIGLLLGLALASKWVAAYAIGGLTIWQGIEIIRGALIDDCALAKALKAHGPIWLGLTERVVFAGRVPHQATPEWYRAADVFVLPSEFDNSPNVVLEAMASGLPVVATDVGGLAEYGDGEDHGRVREQRPIPAVGAQP